MQTKDKVDWFKALYTFDEAEISKRFYKTRAGEPNPFRVGVKASPLADERKI